MVKRVTLSLPDELYTRLKKHKGKFNLSKEFQKLMSDLVGKEESSSTLDLEKIAERLRKERDAKRVSSAQEAGYRWASKASYGDLQSVLSGKMSHEFTLEVLNRHYDKKNYKDSSGRINQEALVWLQGWLEGVATLWARVQRFMA